MPLLFALITHDTSSSANSSIQMALPLEIYAHLIELPNRRGGKHCDPRA